MRFFSRFRLPRFNTIIGHDTVVHGDVEFTGGLHLEGRIEGNVVSRPKDERATLTVSESGFVRGNVQVANVILNGIVLGDVEAGGRVELAEKARVNGRVCYRCLEMAMGATVNSKLVHLDEVAAAKAEAEEAKSQPPPPRRGQLASICRPCNSLGNCCE